MSYIDSETHNKLVAAVAEHLPGWKYELEQDRSEAWLAGKDGMRLYFHHYKEKGKVHISGNWPQHLNGGYRSPRDWGVVGYNESYDADIGVTLSRGPEVIAKEITRRLLPQYTDLYRQCLDRKEKEALYCDGVRERAEFLAAACGTKLNEHRLSKADSQINVTLKRFEQDKWYGDATVNSKVDVKLNNLTVQQAIAVVKLLNEETK